MGRGRAHREETLLVPLVLIAKLSLQPGLQQEAGGSLTWETEEFYEGTAYRKGRGWLNCQGVVTQPGTSSSWRPGAPQGAREGGSRTREKVTAERHPVRCCSLR